MYSVIVSRDQSTASRADALTIVKITEYLRTKCCLSDNLQPFNDGPQVSHCLRLIVLRMRRAIAPPLRWWRRPILSSWDKSIPASKLLMNIKRCPGESLLLTEHADTGTTCYSTKTLLHASPSTLHAPLRLHSIKERKIMINGHYRFCVTLIHVPAFMSCCGTTYRCNGALWRVRRAIRWVRAV